MQMLLDDPPRKERQVCFFENLRLYFGEMRKKMARIKNHEGEYNETKRS